MTTTALMRNTIDLPRARQGIARLLRDKEDTEAVFEIMGALSGKTIPNAYRKLLTTVEGGKIALEGVELQPILDDHDTLLRLPLGSVGRAYVDFVQGRKISAGGLSEESRKVNAQIDMPHPYAWMARRLRDVHDIWHVLTGYQTDALGEVCVVAFSYAQTRSTGFAVIAAAGSNELQNQLRGHRVRGAAWQAYQNGRKAAWLPAQDYVALLKEPLISARQRLNILAPSLYSAIPEAQRNGAMIGQAA
jgi:ubiquinone biosynthesis protein COQ4